MISEILKGKRYVLSNSGLYYVTCKKTNFPSVFIRTADDGYLLELSPDTYVLEVSIPGKSII